MASRSRPEEIVLEALDDECLSLGTYSVRPDKDGFVSRIPSVAANDSDVDLESELKKFYHQETGAVVSIPVDALEEEDSEP